MAAEGELDVWLAVLVGAAVAGPSLLVGPKRSDVRVDAALASMAFLFGVLFAFTIIRTRECLALVQDLLAKGNASVFSIHQAMAVFPEYDRRRVRALSDTCLTDQIDYRLVDSG